MNSTQIDQIIAEQAQANPFSGAILVRRNDETVHAQGYGLAYRPESIPNTINTRFGTASGTKTFTATAICQLAEQGKIDLNAPITDYITADNLPKYNPGVTVHHLLSHTSGIPDYLDEDLMSDEDMLALFVKFPAHTLRRPIDYLPMFPAREMHFTPGERFRYCNGGFVLLSLIVEQQSGMPYQQYVEQNVFARAGMTDSGFLEADRLPERTALGYLHDAETNIWRSNIFSLPVIGCGDGGSYITAPDMVKFWDALLGYRLLSETMTEAMLTPHTVAGEPGENKHYGYGVWITTDSAGAISRYSAIGGDMGVGFISSVFPHQNTLVTVVANTNNVTSSVFDKICNVILE
jgi:CubicO group peptidase (beta-lactamase class C family)